MHAVSSTPRHCTTSVIVTTKIQTAVSANCLVTTVAWLSFSC